MGDSPSFNQDGSLVWLALLVLAVPAMLALLTGFTAWQVYRQPTTGRLVEHGVLLQVWLWVWVLAGPRYQAQWGYWPPALFLAHALLLAGRVVARRRARRA